MSAVFPKPAVPWSAELADPHVRTKIARCTGTYHDKPRMPLSYMQALHRAFDVMKKLDEVVQVIEQILLSAIPRSRGNQLEAARRHYSQIHTLLQQVNEASVPVAQYVQPYLRDLKTRCADIRRKVNKATIERKGKRRRPR